MPGWLDWLPSRLAMHAFPFGTFWERLRSLGILWYRPLLDYVP
jgi:hypothetical protein